MTAPAIFFSDLFAATRSRETGKVTVYESRSEEAGHGPAARLGLRICHSSDGGLCDYAAASSEGLIARSIHRHCQFHLRVIQEAGSAPLVGLIGQDVSRGST